MYIVSIFIAVINTLLNNHEKVNKLIQVKLLLSRRFFTSSYFLEKIFQLQVGPSMGYNQLQWMYLWINYNDLKNGSVDVEFYNYMYDLIIA